MKKATKIRAFIIIFITIAVSIIIVRWFFNLENDMIHKESKVGLIDISSLSEFHEIENAFIYFGRESCEKCLLYEPILKEILNENKQAIYYFNTNYFRNETETTEEELQELFADYEIVGIPMIIEIKNGKLETKLQLEEFKKDETDQMRDVTKEYLLSKVH